MEQNFKVLPIYEEPFRRIVIEEYLATGCTKKGAVRLSITSEGKCAIQRWMRLYGYVDTHTRQKRKS